MKINTLTPNHSHYPEQLATIPSPPKKLYVLGDLTMALSTHRVAIVGSRKVTSYGIQVTQHIVQTFRGREISVISGLALGVDSVAHRAALDAGITTVAVMPCGLDQIYPRTHHQLAQKILAAGGALLSEYPEGTPPLRQHFIARNRLVSGLSDIVIVTEAAEKSGTLHTANFALEQGRGVLAVPGNITNPLSQGTNNLIKAGAEPLVKPSDALFALGIDETTSNKTFMGDTEEETLVLKLLSDGVADVSELQRRSKLPSTVFNQTLTMLEINGLVRSLGSGQWTLVR